VELHRFSDYVVPAHRERCAWNVQAGLDVPLCKHSETEENATLLCSLRS
jgi:hypothetical protein